MTGGPLIVMVALCISLAMRDDVSIRSWSFWALLALAHTFALLAAYQIGQ